MNRRHLLAALAALPLVAACTSQTTEPATAPAGGPQPTEPFSYRPTGYEGLEISLDGPALRVVCDIYSAAALLPYGIQPVGVWGYGHDGAGKGDLDMDAQNVLGLDGEFSLEKLQAARPDLVIGVGNTDGSGWTWWDEKVTTEATKVAPFLPVKMSGNTPDQMIAEYAAIAEALGVDVANSPASQEKSDYDAALQRLTEVAAARPDISVLAINATADEVYTSDKLGVIRMLDAAGLNLVAPPTPAESAWSTNSWEVIGDYPSDVVLLAATSPDAVKEVPLYQRLPAVAAGQVGDWDDKRAYTSKLYAAWLTELADLLESADDIVS
ncbi:ABC transporter substrate-binding protein [Parenemella sanctibonifatiensis]|uniref:ABC transporter substrate-binding protein n=1 Tax=Parenemella sanctibonifatiensis TaxID=2016505 RepID=A0A255EEC0_9ACTN|nr:ABC transporter substrate-binding protein [Parenemella sanctibonifatiensis]OYN87895.1 ABC transporter substrate-binding protein [Parenemella sanctibonifatiensis]